MSAGGLASGPLICPGCGSSHGAQERFCAACRLPLIHDPDQIEPIPVDERYERARKIKPQLAEGKLVRVVGARNLMEAEFIQGLLLEEGVPSLLRRSPGFDVPDFLAAGPRDILVPQSGLDVARDVLLQAEIITARGEGGERGGAVRPGRLAVGLLVALGIGVLVVWAMTLMVH
jgi:hypothetical protein